MPKMVENGRPISSQRGSNCRKDHFCGATRCLNMVLPSAYNHGASGGPAACGEDYCNSLNKAQSVGSPRGRLSRLLGVEGRVLGISTLFYCCRWFGCKEASKHASSSTMGIPFIADKGIFGPAGVLCAHLVEIRVGNVRFSLR